MKKNGNWLILCILDVVLLTFVEESLQPTYWIKSLIKIIVFVKSILLYCLVEKKKIRDVLNLQPMKNGKILFLSVLFIYCLVVIGFLLIKKFLDLNTIRESLLTKENVNPDNFLFVFSYIIICNSFLEEAYFRGFIAQLGDKKSSFLYAALLFAIYHFGMVSSWLNPVLLAVCILSLAFVSLFLQMVDNHFHSLYAGWLLHAGANLAINTIGTLLVLQII